MMLQSDAMPNVEETKELIEAIASRAGTASEIAKWYGYSIKELKRFVEEHIDEIHARSVEVRKEEERRNDPPDVVTPTQLDELWISQKAARLMRYQNIADKLYNEAMSQMNSGSDYATALRELRSYMLAAANELGQLLHRGAGEAGTGDVLNIEIEGIDLEKLK